MQMKIFNRKIILAGINTLFFIFAYNLFCCAYYKYITAKGVRVQDVGQRIDACGQRAFFTLILFVVLKSIYLKIHSKKDEGI